MLNRHIILGLHTDKTPLYRNYTTTRVMNFSFLPSLLTLLVCKSVGWPWRERRGCCKRLIIGCGDTLLYSMLRAGDRERGEFLGDCFGEGQGELRGDGENLLTAGCTVWCVPSSSSSKLCASSSWSLNVPRRVELQEEPELRRDAVAAYSCRRPGNNKSVVYLLPAHKWFPLETVHTVICTVLKLRFGSP